MAAERAISAAFFILFHQSYTFEAPDSLTLVRQIL